MNILEDINFEKLDGFSKTPEAKYRNYVLSHCDDVQKAYDYLKEYLYDEIFPQLEIPENEMDEMIEKHDKSKFSKEELDAYADHFYGNNGKEQDEESPEYKLAWKHHYTTNPHHPEYWGKKSDMPFSCILEMICDWWSFSWKNGDLHEIFKFWEKDKDEKSKYLSPKTIEKVEWFLDLLKNHLKKNSNTSIKQIEEALSILTESNLIKTKDIIDTKQFDKIQNMIKSADKILIVRHISPDADAIGSAKGLWRAIREKFPNKKVILGTETTRIDLTAKDVLIMLDLGVTSRIAAQYTGNPKVIRIDHHPTGMKADICIELPEAGSTAEIITLFLDDQGYKITKEISEALFKGIISDTGRLQYSLSQTTLAAISILTGFGLDYKKVYNQMYVKDEISLKGKTYILNNYKKTPNGVAYLYLDRQRARMAGIDFEKTGTQVHEMGEIEGCPIWVVIMDRGNGKFNMRVRSRIISINSVAKEFGGGGHNNACGISVNSKDEVKRVLTRLDTYLKDKKREIPLLKEEALFEGKFTTKIEPIEDKRDEGDQEAYNVKFYDNGQYIGHAAVSSDYDGEKLSFLYNVEVEKEFRGKGYGTKIVQYMIDKYNVKYLQVKKDNDIAIKLYKKFGFKITSNVRTTDGIQWRMEREKKKANINESTDNNNLRKLLDRVNSFKYGDVDKNLNILQRKKEGDAHPDAIIQSPEQIEKSKSAHCIEKALYFASKIKKDHFFLSFLNNSHKFGHTIVVFIDNDDLVVPDWDGIHKFNNEDEIKSFYKKKYCKNNNFDKIFKHKSLDFIIGSKTKDFWDILENNKKQLSESEFSDDLLALFGDALNELN